MQRECGPDERDEQIVRALKSLVFETDSTIVGRVQQTIATHSRRRSYRRRVAWLLASAAALMLTAIPAYLGVSSRQRQAELAADRVLWERVQSRLTRAVPVVLEPLMESAAVASGEPR